MNNSNKIPLVSIIINFHNAQNFIKKALDSVFKQSFKRWELILFDNCSTDQSIEIIKKYQTDERVKYYRSKEFVDLGTARNLALNEVRTNFIAILDSDDEMMPERLYKQYSYLLKNKNIFLVSSWVKIIDFKDKTIANHQPTLDSKSLYQRIGWENPIVHSSVMYRKKLNSKSVKYNSKIKYAQDYDFYIRYIDEDNFIIINDFLSKNRIHQDNLTKSKSYSEIIALEQIVHLKNASKLKLNTFSKRLNMRSLNLCYVKLVIINLTKFKIKLSVYYFKKININIIELFFHFGPIRRSFKK